MDGTNTLLFVTGEESLDRFLLFGAKFNGDVTLDDIILLAVFGAEDFFGKSFRLRKRWR